MRHVFETMGTVASVELPTGYSWVLPRIETIFRDIDHVFSLYRPDSELTRIAAGAIPLTEASAAVLASYDRSNEWRIATSGLFTPHRPDGVLDLNGIVKAEAIESAGRLLDEVECPTWSLNVGGDILVRSDAGPSATGVADPADSSAILCSVLLGHSRTALATSGSSQRGDHIWRRGELRPAEFVQVSVMADDIVTADVLATAIVAGGPGNLDDITDRWDVDVLTVDRRGRLMATPGFERAAA